MLVSPRPLTHLAAAVVGVGDVDASGPLAVPAGNRPALAIVLVGGKTHLALVGDAGQGIGVIGVLVMVDAGGLIGVDHLGESAEPIVAVLPVAPGVIAHPLEPL